MNVLTVFGVGNLRCSPAVIASIANYYGEEELVLRLFDPDAERLDLFERFARLCIDTGYSRHSILATMDPQEALDDADYLIVQLAEESARKWLRDPDGKLPHALKDLLRSVAEKTDCLSLIEEPLPLARYQAVQWPPQLTEEERRAMPLQLLRWINGEDSVWPYVESNSHSPVKRWLENPLSLPFEGSES